MKKLLLANWKMNFTVGESTAFLTELLFGENSIRAVRGVETVLAPSFLALNAMHRAGSEHIVGLCAQDAYFRQSGACCSAIFPRMLREVCDYVCLGRSERRIRFGDTNEILREKVRTCEESAE